MTLAAGSRLGPYEIVSPLGAGGMGEVYRARDLRLERMVAIKVLPPRLARDSEALARFEREARAVAALSHPNILAIHDFGNHEGTAYAVMELLDGKTLREWLLAGPLLPRKAIEYAVQVAQGLGAAHEKGIVHRDLKPENLFLTSDGRVKILDFGLARLTTAPLPPASLTEAPTAARGTEPGVVMGTVGYMSPEQVRGYAADHRSDLFSFGAVLYETLTGQRAFQGRSAADTMSAVLSREPEFSGTVPNIAPGLEQIVRRCLEKNVEERFQSARDLAFALSSMSSSGKSASVPLLSRSRRPLAIAAAAVLAIGLAAVGLLTFMRDPGPIDSLAVLPFANTSGDPETEYLSDGITESLINKLSQLSGVRVISRASVFRYKGKDPDPRTISRELGVRAIVTGRVTQRGDRLSIASELVDARDNRQVWGERYDRKLADVLELQEEIVRQISQSLQLRLTGEEQARLAKRSTTNSEAYQAYLRGFHHTRKFTEEDVRKGMEYFQQALALDPRYAPAYAGLAYAYISGLADWYMPAKEAFRLGKEAARRAVELDPSLAEGHTFLAVAEFLYDYDWPGAEQEFRRAIEANPRDAPAHFWYGTYRGALGQFEAGLQEIRLALELDPLSLETNHVLGMHFYYWRRYDDAIEQLKRTLDLDANYFWAEMVLGQSYEQKGQFQGAVAAFERARKLTAKAGETPPEILAGLIRGHALAGNRVAALAPLEELKKLTSRRYVSRHDLAIAYLALGDEQQAMDWLEKAYEDRNWWMPWLKVEPRFDPLRTEPRFRALLDRMNFPASGAGVPVPIPPAEESRRSSDLQ